MTDGTRRVKKVVAGINWWDGSKAREVVAEYNGGQTRREIEVAIDGEYVAQFADIEANKSKR